MRDSDAIDPPGGAQIIGYTGIYNADGGVVGEVRYLFGHLFGSVECSLCDITHSPLRRKPEWDRMVARTGVPIALRHRNELDERLEAAVRDLTLPVVVAHRSDGSTSVALTADRLAELDGSVDGFEKALLSAHPNRLSA